MICCAGAIDVRGAGGSAAVGEVDSLNQKVGELYRQGKYSEALPLAERALEHILFNLSRIVHDGRSWCSAQR